MAHRRARLAVPAELGPDRHHGLVQLEPTLGHRVEERQRRKRLGDREGHDEGVGGPRVSPVPGPDRVVDEDRAVTDDGDGTSRFASTADERIEDVGRVSAHEASPYASAVRPG